MFGNSRGIHAQHEAQAALSAAVVQLIPPDATALRITASLLDPVSLYTFDAEADDGSVEYVRRPRGLDLGLIRNLRAAMYQDGLGTWFSAVIRVDRSGAVDATFNYDDEPEWDAPVDSIAYLTDQETFPRDVEKQPPWLQEKIAEGVKRRRELGFE
ncbi:MULTISPECIES: hypothetical protein [Tsukamurella]|uniref:Uncharacterized protein n=2 Tax=Tsukamurella TaxID=2060 RepID=A0A5C5RYH9_9ACTN|nr:MULTISPECIES: hypothetical protein [Tsukamurella]NMD55857.1 hypothetical protein [Tsukamurella columbiensis]TWS27548.1 hypothetical protein FK530_17580 [Tsukamurella conjunctivitidis]